MYRIILDLQGVEVFFYFSRKIISYAFPAFQFFFDLFNKNFGNFDSR